MPPRRQPFPPEPITEPEVRASTKPPKSKRGREVDTVPPPPSKRANSRPTARPHDAQRTSGTRSRRPAPKRDAKDASGATVDEVVADLSKDPRRERE